MLCMKHMYCMKHMLCMKHNYVLYETYVLYEAYIMCETYVLYEAYVMYETYVLYEAYIMCETYVLYETYVMYETYVLYETFVLYETLFAVNLYGTFLLPSGQYYVPLIRSDDNTSAPLIGQPWSPDISKGPLDVPRVTSSPRDSALSVRACAGPMSPVDVRYENLLQFMNLIIM